MAKIDPTRRLNKRERVALTKRVRRIEAAADSIDHASSELRRLAAPRASSTFRLRQGYTCLASPLAPISGRAAPPVEHRPPATRLMSANGIAMRFHLLALGEAQLLCPRAGTTHRNDREIGRSAAQAPTAWSDLLGSHAADSGPGNTSMLKRDKKIRHIHAGLDRLEHNGLVYLPNRSAVTGRYEQFVLLDEESGMPQPGADPVLYRTPRLSERFFTLPMTFVTNGWVQVLEDTELAVLLMIACGAGSVDEAGIAIPGDVRNGAYGISRHAFESHRMLHRFGLITVEEVNRHEDGKAELFDAQGASLHRLNLVPQAFEWPAPATLAEKITYELSR